MVAASDRDALHENAPHRDAPGPGVPRPDLQDTLERVKELLVYGPVGLALYLRDTAPSFVQLFVTRGRNALRPNAATAAPPASGTPAGPAPRPPAAPDGDRGREEAGVRVQMVETGAHVLRVVSDGLSVARRRTGDALRSRREDQSQEDPVELVIAEYDQLSASELVDRLDELPPDELEIIRDYERAHRARSTVLGKIEQLTRPATA